MHHLFLVLLSFLVLPACQHFEASPLEVSAYNPDSSIFTIAEQNSETHIRQLDEILTTQNCEMSELRIDIDGDNEMDFLLQNYQCNDFITEESFLKIFSIGDANKILANADFSEPAILVSGDTLDRNKNWWKNNLQLTKTWYKSTAQEGSGIHHEFGNWRNLSGNYIGLQLNKDGRQIFAWLKIEVSKAPKAYCYDLKIEEIGWRAVE